MILQKYTYLSFELSFLSLHARSLLDESPHSSEVSSDEDDEDDDLEPTAGVTDKEMKMKEIKMVSK